MPRAAYLAGLAITALTLSGCSTNPEGNSTDVGDGAAYVVHVTVDGRSIPCIVYDGNKSGAITCDWSAK